MRLSEFNPRWVSISRWDSPDGTQHYYDTPPRIGGVSFNCPIHTAACGACGQYLPQTHRLVVFFSNPLDGGLPQVIEHRWQRTGETFDTLTLSPSINASEYIGQDGVVCWHGFIENGEIRPLPVSPTQEPT